MGEILILKSFKYFLLHAKLNTEKQTLGISVNFVKYLAFLYGKLLSTPSTVLEINLEYIL